MPHLLVLAIIVKSLQATTSSVVFYDISNKTVSVPSYPFQSTLNSPNLTAPIAFNQHRANHTTVFYVTAVAFPFQSCVDDCNRVGCAAVVFYTKNSLQTLLEIAASTLSIRNAKFPVLAVGPAPDDFASRFKRLALDNPDPSRLIQALHDPGLQFVMWAVLIHRIINIVLITRQFYRFGFGIFRTPFPLCILMIYTLSSVYGIMAFGNLAIFFAKLLSYYSLVFAFCLGVPLVYSGRMLLGFAMDKVTIKANMDHSSGCRLRIKHALLVAVLAANFIFSLEIALDPQATNFKLLFWLQVATLILLSALNIPTAFQLCKAIVCQSRRFQLGDAERRMRLRFAYKMVGGTIASIMMWAIQIFIIIFQPNGPLTFLLMYGLLSFAMSQVVIFSVWVLRPSPRGGAMIPISNWLHSRASIAVGGSRIRPSKSIIAVTPKPQARSLSPARKSYSPGMKLPTNTRGVE